MNRTLLIGVGVCAILAGSLALYALTKSPLIVGLAVGLSAFLVFLLADDPIANRQSSDDVPEDASVIDLASIKPRHIASVIVPLLILWTFGIGNYSLGVTLTVLSALAVGVFCARGRIKSLLS